MQIKRFSFFVILLLIAQVSYAQRYALVIGNSNYNIGSLKNPVNDASDMAVLLEEKGFKVQKLLNANQRKMDKAIAQFTNRLYQKNAIGLFYYAGHGIEVDGRNYLIPLGANIEDETAIKYESVDAGRVMDGMERAGNNLNMVILDACRNNPYARSFRSSGRGLARMDAAKGSLVLYATSPGDVASDGAGRNGLFTQHLLASIKKPDLTVENVFKQTAKLVYQSTSGKQTPWQSGVIIDDFYFTLNAPNAETVIINQPVINSNRAEILFWESIKSEADPVFFNSYLATYPTGIYSALAKLKVKKNSAAIPIKSSKNTLVNKAYLTVKTEPANAKVRILNITPKYQQGIELDPGRYHIEVSHGGYQRYRQWVELKNEDTLHNVVLEKKQQFVMELPVLKVGDSWTMQYSGVTDALSDMKVVGETVYQGQEAYKIQDKGTYNGVSYLSKATLEMIGIEFEVNGKAHETTYRYEYPSGRQWPMEVGKRWQVKRFTKSTNGESIALYNNKAVAKESLSVGNDIFECLKVISNITNTEIGFDQVTNYWWCPKLKYVGLSRTNTTFHAKTKSKLNMEDSSFQMKLTAYSIAP